MYDRIALIFTMASNSKKRKRTSQVQRLSRSDLLPMSPAIGRSLSLKYHMALAAMRMGKVTSISPESS
jgi:hypothetical protein